MIEQLHVREHHKSFSIYWVSFCVPRFFRNTWKLTMTAAITHLLPLFHVDQNVVNKILFFYSFVIVSKIKVWHQNTLYTQFCLYHIRLNAQNENELFLFHRHYTIYLYWRNCKKNINTQWLIRSIWQIT